MTGTTRTQRFNLVKETVFNFYNVRTKVSFDYQEKARDIILVSLVLIILACFILFLAQESSESIVVGFISAILFLVFFNFRYSIVVEYLIDYVAFLFWGMKMEREILNQKRMYQAWLVTLQEDIDNMSSFDNYMYEAQKAREITRMKI